MPEALTTAELEAAEVAIIEALHQNPRLTVKAAVERAGISRTTYYRLRSCRRGFADRIDAAQAAARQAALDDLEEHLFERSADPKNPTGCTSAIFLLKGNRSSIYAEHKPQGGQPVNIYIDNAQLLLERQTSDEVRRLESAESGSRGGLELEPDDADAWAVRQ